MSVILSLRIMVTSGSGVVASVGISGRGGVVAFPADTATPDR